MTTKIVPRSSQPNFDAELDRLRDAFIDRICGSLLDMVTALLDKRPGDRLKTTSDNSQRPPSSLTERRVKKLLAERDDILDLISEAQDCLDGGDTYDAAEIIDDILQRFEVSEATH